MEKRSDLNDSTCSMVNIESWHRWRRWGPRFWRMFNVQMIASGLITASGSLNWKLKVYIIIFGYWLKYPWRYVWVIFVIEVCSMFNLNHCVESLLQVCKVSAVIKVHFWKGYVADKVLKHWLFFIYRFYFSSVVVLVFLVTLWPERIENT